MSWRRRVSHLQTITRDPRWWRFYLQRRFMGTRLRPFLARAASKLRPAVEVQEEAEPAIGALEQEGLWRLGSLLTADQCAEVRAHLSKLPVHDPYRPGFGSFLPEGGEQPNGCHVAHHDAADILRAPYLLDLANNPRLLSIASAFLGCKPVLGYLAAWWSYPTGNGPQQAEFFHRDVDDWRFLKLFVYLSDVGTENGPHVYVPGSSSSGKLRRLGRFSDPEVEAAFGPDGSLELTGRAGDAFLEDTFGLHKGQPVTSGRRLMFQAVYSMWPLPYGPRRPALPAGDVIGRVDSTIDLGINRVYLGPPGRGGK